MEKDSEKRVWTKRQGGVFIIAIRYRVYAELDKTTYKYINP